MLPGERRYQILELLKINRAVTVKELCDALETSEATIRRDLAIMEEEGKLERTHGGAILYEEQDLVNEENYYQKETVHVAEKRSIAERGFQLIQEGDAVLLDSGTTTLELAKLIGRSQMNLTVITNSATFSAILAGNPNLTLILLGGKVRLNTLATVGSIAIEALKRLHVNKAFVGVNGISLENGLMTTDLEEADIKRAMIQSAKETYVITDSSKFKKMAMCRIVPVTMVDAVITDADLPAAIEAQLLENDVQVIKG